MVGIEGEPRGSGADGGRREGQRAVTLLGKITSRDPSVP